MDLSTSVLQAVPMLLQLAQTNKVDFWTAYLAFRQHYQLADLALAPDSIFANVRDRSPGRDIEF